MIKYCPPENELALLAVGTSEDASSQAVAEHVSSCEACQNHLDKISGSDAFLKDGLQAVRLGNSKSAFEGDACRLSVLKALGALSVAHEDAGTLSVPTEIGEYAIIRPLGAGGMGHVLLAKHTRLNRLVAVKLLSHRREFDNAAKQRFASEMQAIGNLSHPNIVAAHDAREIEGRPVLVMEYVDGVDLSTLLSSQAIRPSVGESCQIGASVAMALEYAASQGVVHRDVKPSNIMVDQGGVVKLLDLGLARLGVGNTELPQASPTNELTATGMPLGTADYIAPEQVHDSREAGPEADIYALGCTLYRLLSGKVPFGGSEYASAFAKLSAHVNDQPEPLGQVAESVPRPVARLVDRMLDKYPENRPDASEVVDTLSNFAKHSNLAGLLVRASTPETNELADRQSEPPLPPRKSSGMKIAIASGFFGLFLGILATIIVTIKRPDGTKETIQAPAGSQVVVTQGPPDPNATARAATVATPQESFDQQLWFGIVAEASAVFSKDDAGQLALALAKTDGSKPIGNGHATYFPVATPEISDDFAEAWTGGRKFLLIQSDGSVPWKDIEGQLLDVQLTDNESDCSIEIEFATPLADRIQDLTSRNLGRKLALICDGEVFMTPTLHSSISNRAQIAGAFSEDQRTELLTILQAAMSGQLDLSGEKFSPLPSDGLNGVWEIVATQAHGEAIVNPGAWLFNDQSAALFSQRVHDVGAFVIGDGQDGKVRFAVSQRWELRVNEVRTASKVHERILRLSQGSTLLYFKVKKVDAGSTVSKYAKMGLDVVESWETGGGTNPYPTPAQWAHLNTLDPRTATQIPISRVSLMDGFVDSVRQSSLRPLEPTLLALQSSGEGFGGLLDVVSNHKHLLDAFAVTEEVVFSKYGSSHYRRYSLEVDWSKAFEQIGPFVDELVKTQGVFEDLIKGIRLDPNGPQVDVHDLLSALADDVSIFQDEQFDSATAVAIRLTNEEAAREWISRVYRNQSDVRIFNEGNDRSYTTEMPSGSMLTTVHDGYLLFGNAFMVQCAIRDLAK